MAETFSTTAQNPANQPAQTGVVPGQTPKEPKSIRDYVKLAREKGIVPSFTNNPGSPLMSQGAMYMPEPQAISEGPSSQYEKMSFSDRMKMDPYRRAQDRIKEFIPDIWSQTFPGMAPGTPLSPEQMNKWQSAVQSVTSGLLKRYDSQYKWALENEQKNANKRDADRKMWQKTHVQMVGRGQPPIDPETGQIIPEAQFVEQRLAISDEMAYKDETRQKERQAGQNADSLTADVVRTKMSQDPVLKRKMAAEVMSSLSERLGVTLTEGEFQQMFKNPAYKEMIGEAMREAVSNNRDAFIQ